MTLDRRRGASFQYRDRAVYSCSRQTPKGCSSNWLERRSPKPEVVGSSPSTPAKGLLSLIAEEN